MLSENEQINEELLQIFQRTRAKKQPDAPQNEPIIIDQSQKVNDSPKKYSNAQKIQNTSLNRKLNILFQSEKIDFNKEEDLEILVNAIKNPQKSNLEARLAVMAFQQLDFFEKKLIFYINDSFTQIINKSIQVQQFQKYSCIQQHGQQSNCIQILVRGKAAVLRVETQNKRHSSSLFSLREKSRKYLEAHHQIQHKQDLNISLNQIQENQVKNSHQSLNHSLNHIDMQYYSHLHQNATDKEKFIEYRIQQENIRHFKNLNDEILKRNYSYAQAKKEALAKHMSKNELIQTLSRRIEQIKQDEAIYSHLKIEDQDYIHQNYPNQQLTRILKVGDYFSEESLIYKTQSNGNIISLDDDCLVISMSREGFENFVKSFYLRIIYNRQNFLKQYKFFETISEREILNMIPEMQELSLSKNSVLYKEGDETDEIYFLYSGQLELQKNYSVQRLNQIIIQYKNDLKGKLVENSNKFYIDISHNVSQKRKKQNPVNKIIQNCQGISIKRTNKDKTNLNMLSCARDNFKNSRLVTLYQYTPGSFCGDIELFEDIPLRQSRVVVLSHQAVILSFKAHSLLNVLKLNKTYEIMVQESQKKNEFYMQRTIDYILLNQNFNKKKSLGTSELMEIINQRKKINLQNSVQEGEEQNQDMVIQQEDNKEDFVIQDLKQIRMKTLNKNQEGIEILDQLQLKQRQNIHQETGQLLNKAEFQENFGRDEFERMDNLNKSLVKKMNILRQGDSIFDSSMPKHLKEVIIKKIKLLRHLTPASVKGVISKVLTEYSKQKSDQVQNKNQQSNQNSQQTIKIQQISPRPQTVLVKSSSGSSQSFSYLNEDLVLEKQKSSKKNYQDLSQSNSLILASDKQEKPIISLQKLQTEQDQLIKQLADNPIKKIFKSYVNGKKNFKQIFLQSLDNKQQRKDSILMLKQGVKIEAIMREKREKNFQQYMSEELVDKRIKVLKKNPEEKLNYLTNENEKDKQEILILNKNNKNKSKFDLKASLVVKQSKRNVSATLFSTVKTDSQSNQDQVYVQQRSNSPSAFALSKFNSIQFQQNQLGFIQLNQDNLGQENIFQDSIQDTQQNKDKINYKQSIQTHFTDRNSQMSCQSYPETQMTTDRNDVDCQFNQCKKLQTDSANNFTRQMVSQQNEQNYFKPDEILVQEFLTERDIPLTKKQTQRSNLQISPKNSQSNQKDFIISQSTQKKQTQFQSTDYFKQNKKLIEKSTDTIKEDNFTNQIFKNKFEHPNLLITLSEYEQKKIYLNTVDSNKNEELEKIKELMQSNKRLKTSNSNIQNRFQSPPYESALKKEIKNNQTKNRSFIISDFAQNNNSLYGLSATCKNHRKLQSTTNYNRDKILSNINEVISPRTNPITYSNLQSKVISRSSKNNAPKETNIHKINLEINKQRQINIPISMSIRRKRSKNQFELNSAL